MSSNELYQAGAEVPGPGRGVKLLHQECESRLVSRGCRRMPWSIGSDHMKHVLNVSAALCEKGEVSEWKAL